jgi:hypothetical protein
MRWETMTGGRIAARTEAPKARRGRKMPTRPETFLRALSKCKWPEVIDLKDRIEALYAKKEIDERERQTRLASLFKYMLSLYREDKETK